MTDLTPCSAFVETGPIQQIIGAFTLRTDEAFKISSISYTAETFYNKTPSLPGPGRWQNIGDACFVWTSENQWLAMTGNDEEFARVFGLNQDGLTVTDQTNAWVAIEVECSEKKLLLEEFLRRLINVDIRVFEQGSATRTAILHCPTIILRCSSNNVRFLVMRSMADSFLEAMRRNLHLLIQRNEIT